jgi:GH43 family beta-xylosidase
MSIVDQSVAWRPLAPSPFDQSDPFVLRVPDEASSEYRYYVYTTGEGGRTDRAFSVFGSHDLTRWARLENALESDLSRAHWAPSVTHVPSLERPWVMLYSNAIGDGRETMHIGHAIRRADAVRPEGPFVPSGEVLTRDLDFAIDPDVFRAPDGRLKIAFAADFVHDPPLGTGIVIADVSEDLKRLTSHAIPIARASAEWQLYDPARSMPWKRIPGVDWAHDRVRWYCLEGPCGGIRAPDGRSIILYSGGCYFGFYAVGALIEGTDGRWRDVASDGRSFVLVASSDDQIRGPGHTSVTAAPNGEIVLFFHARFGGERSPRQMTFAPLRFDADGLPHAARS